jgi:hypothetical protein
MANKKRKEELSPGRDRGSVCNFFEHSEEYPFYFSVLRESRLSLPQSDEVSYEPTCQPRPA